jgi:hypothetical protein
VPFLEKDELIKKARRVETAAHIEEWVNPTCSRQSKNGIAPS